SVEQKLYEGWEHSGSFAAGGARANAEPYTIMIPPPNVTGALHMGHALTFTIQDTLVRWRRMQGRDALWQPGSDHAGIATQMVVERMLAAEGTSRQALGRDAFLDRVWQWKTESGGTITRQLRRLGASLDWPRERFTMDDGLSAAVREVFVTLYEQKLIYRDRRLVNWDPKFQSAISDLEVEGREIRGNLWHIVYPLEGGGSLIVATTRPETMLGDTAVAVHPEHPTLAALIGRHVVLPLTGRRIPVIGDSYADPEKGTGAVKITPAHDFNDFEVGRRHNLPMPSVLDREARVTLAEIGGEPGVAASAFLQNLQGQGREAARAAIVAELDRLGLLAQVEPHTHAVPHGDRSGVAIEPLLTEQWYCNAEVLAKPAIEAVEQGRVQFVPKQWENTFFAWMRDIKPWCISRQLWWGHRIPAWYAPDGSIFVARTAEKAIAAAAAKFGAGTELTQDPDVLDTWFSSGLWPFSTLGWPEKTEDLARYYPTDVLVTGFDIIFFWVARMLMMGLHFMGDVPFRTVAIHGLVRDERGQKMSKSKGNVIDPLAMIEEYGADALRFAVCTLTGPGRDIKLGPQKIAEGRAFVTKLWNAARFAEMNGVAPDPAFRPELARLPLSRWLLAEARAAVAQANAALESFRFDEYADACTRFTWNIFCDWFLELAKPVLTGTNAAEAAEMRATAAFVLGIILRLLHPAIPFVTETIWDGFGYGAALSLARESWPDAWEVHEPQAAKAELDWVIRFITAVRTVRAEMNVPPSVPGPVWLRDAAPETSARAARWAEPAKRLARISDIAAAPADTPAETALLLLDEATLLLPLAGLIDVAAERTRLAKEAARAEDDAEKVARKLANADFVARAPAEVVAENRAREASARAESSRLRAALARLS
ncbi:MAG TPA: valine--tRNA ligase, partial [Acetobacteraceae bacterium]|nr:valine--tRNA ligase [Acetobacteraceae bacterium]